MTTRCADAAVVADGAVRGRQPRRPGRRRRRCGDRTVRTSDPPAHARPLQHPTAPAVAGGRRPDAARGSETGR